MVSTRGMPDLFEELVRELSLECVHEPRRCLSGRVGDDVELDRRCFLLPGRPCAEERI